MVKDWPPFNKKDGLQIEKIIFKKKISISDGSGIIKEFEKRFSKFIKIKHCLSQNNGTSTLHAAFFSIGLKPGDEVLVPSYTWHTSVSPMLHLGAKPVFCEINPKTLTINPKDIKSKINSKTKAIVVVHLWGMPAQMDEIMSIAKKNKLYVIEDCSHAYGSLYKGGKVGTFGDIACFSMQSSKLLASGEGGVFCTNNKDFYEKALLLGHHGRLNELKNKNYQKFSYTGLGFKYRANPLSISLANSLLKRIDKLNKTKCKNINYFENLIREIPGITVLEKPEYAAFRSYFEFKFLYDETITKYPKNKFVFRHRLNLIPMSDERKRYPLLHKEPLFNKNMFLNQTQNQKRLPITEKIHSQIITLDIPYTPNFKLMDRYYHSINSALKNKF